MQSELGKNPCFFFGWIKIKGYKAGIHHVLSQVSALVLFFDKKIFKKCTSAVEIKFILFLLNE